MKVYGETPQLLHMQGKGPGNKPAGSLVVSSYVYVNGMAKYGIFVLSHFCIHKYIGAIAAVHVMRNVYIFIVCLPNYMLCPVLIRRQKICLEMEHYLITYMST